MTADMRKQRSVKCYELRQIGYFEPLELIPATIVEYLGKKIGRDHVVATVAQRSGSSRPARHDISLNMLIAPGKQTHAVLDQLNQIREKQRQLNAQHVELMEKLPRMTPEHIMGLIEISDHNEADV